MTLEEAQARYPRAEAFKFGDGAVLCAALIELVRDGKKTATCGALRDFESGEEALPEIGRIDIALNWDDRPALAIRTTDVTLQAFSAVDADFALAEGENDSLAGWQRDHKAFFARNGGWDADMTLVCERFEVVEDFG